jgi:hypothetical protein
MSLPENKNFAQVLDHVAGVTLQTLSIERSADADGADHALDVVQDVNNIWTLHFKKKKGVWAYDRRSWRASQFTYEPS